VIDSVEFTAHKSTPVTLTHWAVRRKF